MNIYGKFTRRMGALLARLFFIILLTYFAYIYINEIRRADLANASIKYLMDDTFQMALWKDANTEENPKDLLIKWWYDSESAKYYFFMPKALSEKDMHWLFPKEYTVTIDGKNVDYGSLCELQEGVYTVTAGQTGGNTQEYTMEFRYSSEIASLFLETDSGSLNYIHEAKENFEAGIYTLLDSSGKYYYSGAIENLHARGNSSWSGTDKKSYQLKLVNKTDLLGMGAAKKWILSANAFDTTLLRNMLSFDIAKTLELAYTPDMKFVDVYANGEYIGNYLLSEKVEIDPNRIALTDLGKKTEILNPGKPLNEYEYFVTGSDRLSSIKGYMIENDPADISGGYLLELELMDRYEPEASGFITSRMQPVVIQSPVYASQKQVSYIAARYQDFEDAIFSENGLSPATGTYFGDYIDMDSFARKYLLEEMTKNLDSSFTSQFLYKPNDSVSNKFFAGPAWDYDTSFGNYDKLSKGFDISDPNGLYASAKTKESNIWYGLYNQDEFRKMALSIYFNEFEPKVKKLAEQDVDKYADAITASAVNDAVRWHVFAEESEPDKKTVIYQKEIDELKNFINARLEYLNNEWGPQNELNEEASVGF